MINSILLVGRLGADPVDTSSDTLSSCYLSVGTEKNVRGDAGQWTRTAEWIPVTLYGNAAINAIAHLRKGSFVAVEGRLTKKVWKTPEGENRSKLAIGSVKIKYGPKAEPKESQKEAVPSSPQGSPEQQEVPVGAYPENDTPY